MNQDRVSIYLDALLSQFNRELDRIHDEALRQFDHLARVTGQRMRVDRATK